MSDLLPPLPLPLVPPHPRPLLLLTTVRFSAYSVISIDPNHEACDQPAGVLLRGHGSHDLCLQWWGHASTSPMLLLSSDCSLAPCSALPVPPLLTVVNSWVVCGANKVALACAVVMEKFDYQLNNVLFKLSDIESNISQLDREHRTLITANGPIKDLLMKADRFQNL